MKKSILLVTLMVAVSAAPSWAVFRAGLKAGANFSKMIVDGNEQINYKQQTGYAIGPMAAIDFSPWTALRTELLFVQKGAKFHDPAGDGTLKNDEVVIAPFLVFNLSGGKAKPFLDVGPEVGFNTLHEVNHSSANSMTKGWKSQNYSLNAGAGLDLPIGPTTLEIDARYNLGLVNLNDNVDGNGKLKTSGFQLLLGYYLFQF